MQLISFNNINWIAIQNKDQIKENLRIKISFEKDILEVLFLYFFLL